MRRLAVAQDRDQPPQEDVVDHRDAVGHAHRRGDATGSGHPLGSRRCPRPAATWSSRRPTPTPSARSRICLDLGAEDRGVLVQRDTYFRVPEGRLKLREETPGGAALIQYAPRRPARGAREPLPDRARRGRRETLREVARRGARHARRRRQGAPAAAVGGRPDPPRHGARASAPSSSSRASRPRTPTCRAERDRVAQLSEALGLDELADPGRLLLGPRAGARRGQRAS